jgi:mRNA-degrading endonuclease RelE of RelBE toxin-antitoxin system
MSANYIVLFSKRFAKLVDKLSDADKKTLLNKIRLLEDDPFYPSLRCKQVKGNPGYYEFSVTMNIRVVWYYQSSRIIVLLKLGGHDIIDEFNRGKWKR